MNTYDEPPLSICDECAAAGREAMANVNRDGIDLCGSCDEQRAARMLDRREAARTKWTAEHLPGRPSW